MDGYTPKEERALKEGLREASAPNCPRCGAPTEITNLPSPREVSYVRTRVYVYCPSCRLRLVVDKK